MLIELSNTSHFTLFINIVEVSNEKNETYRGDGHFTSKISRTLLAKMLLQSSHSKSVKVLCSEKNIVRIFERVKSRGMTVFNPYCEERRTPGVVTSINLEQRVHAAHVF